MVTFPNASRVELWYQTATDGIHHLESLLHSHDARRVSSRTHNAIYGMTAAEWRDFAVAKLEDHELSACMALLAVVEGAIRRDLEARLQNHGKHHLALQALLRPGRHVSVVRILQRWTNTLSGTPAHKHLIKLQEIYINRRNILAHGRANHGQFVFAFLFHEITVAGKKWHDQVNDFRGF